MDQAKMKNFANCIKGAILGFTFALSLVSAFWIVHVDKAIEIGIKLQDKTAVTECLKLWFGAQSKDGIETYRNKCH